MTALELELGRRFPSAYRVKMLRENGGSVVIAGEHWHLFPVENRESRKHISRTCNHVLKESRLLWSGGLQFPEFAVAIGENGSGDYLFLRFSEVDEACYRSDLWIWRLRGGRVEPSGRVDEVFGTVGWE